MIKHFIGKLTYPKDAVSDKYGHWIPVSYIPLYRGNFSWELKSDYSSPYNYQKIEQNWYGRWVPCNPCLGMNNPIKKTEA